MKSHNIKTAGDKLVFIFDSARTGAYVDIHEKPFPERTTMVLWLSIEEIKELRDSLNEALSSKG